MCEGCAAASENSEIPPPLANAYMSARAIVPRSVRAPAARSAKPRRFRSGGLMAAASTIGPRAVPCHGTSVHPDGFGSGVRRRGGALRPPCGKVRRSRALVRAFLQLGVDGAIATRAALPRAVRAQLPRKRVVGEAA